MERGIDSLHPGKMCSCKMYQILKVTFAWKTSLKQSKDVLEFVSVHDTKWI